MIAVVVFLLLFLLVLAYSKWFFFLGGGFVWFVFLHSMPSCGVYQRFTLISMLLLLLLL